MAIKTFGIKPTLTSAYWGGVPYYANVGYRTVMPERGKLISIALRLARYSDNEVPLVWGTIWNRSSGALLAQSNHSHSPNNTYSNLASLQIYTFNFDGQVIEAGTLLWIGYGKRSNQSGRAFHFGAHNNTSGHFIDYNDVSQSAPATTFTATSTHSNNALWVEVTYESGGEIKVWDGSSFVQKPVKVFNGSSWVTKPVKHYKDGQWYESN